MAPTSPFYDKMDEDRTWTFLRRELEDEAVLNDLLRIPAGTNLSVLDIGTGTGEFIAAARSRSSGRLVGIDESPTMIAAAQEHLGLLDVPQEPLPDLDEDPVIILPVPIIALYDPSIKAVFMQISPGGKGFDFINCMHVLSRFRCPGRLLQILNDLLEPHHGRLVFDWTHSHKLLDGVDYGTFHPYTKCLTWTSSDSFAHKKHHDEVASEAKMIVEESMPGCRIELIRDSAHMNDRISSLHNSPYGSRHESLSIPGETLGNKWSWADALGTIEPPPYLNDIKELTRIEHRLVDLATGVKPSAYVGIERIEQARLVTAVVVVSRGGKDKEERKDGSGDKKGPEERKEGNCG